MTEEENVFKSPGSELLDKNNIVQNYEITSGSVFWSKADLASPPKRFQAQFIDGLISLLIFVVTILMVKGFGIEGSLADVLIVAFPAMYFLFRDGLPKGQSIGKRFFQMSVIHKDTGKPCTYLQSFLRNILVPILGWIDAVLIFLETRQRLGDYLANTVVVKVKIGASSV